MHELKFLFLLLIYLVSILLFVLCKSSRRVGGKFPPPQQGNFDLTVFNRRLKRRYATGVPTHKLFRFFSARIHNFHKCIYSEQYESPIPVIKPFPLSARPSSGTEQ